MTIKQPDWSLPPGVRAVYTTRQGGVSRAPYSSFNTALHVGDDPAAVAKNRAELERVTKHPTQWLNQVHGTAVAEISNVSPEALTADAVITSTAGVVCAVQTADCLPVLLSDEHGEQVAAVHAGWRGLAAGILSATVARFRSRASDLSAWLGPAISQAHFEVGEDVLCEFEIWADRLGVQHEHLYSAFIRQSYKYKADLYALARLELASMGVISIQGGSACTWRDTEFYYSYRREGVTGRMTSAIWIETPT